MPVTQHTYQMLVLEDPEGQWELHHGRVREKPAMSFTHNEVMTEIGYLLKAQLDPNDFVVRVNAGRLKRTGETYYIPDAFVIPRRMVAAGSREPNTLEVYEEPVSLVVEIWSPPTGDYDVDKKIPEYQRRGDFEIWRIHPYDRTVTVWT